MTIKERVAEKRKEIKDAQRLVEVRRAELVAIQAECEHINRFNYTVQGDPTQDCADCEKGFF